MFEAWAEATEIPEIHCDDREIVAALRFRDRFATAAAASMPTWILKPSIHLVITDGTTSILDYGRTTRTSHPPHPRP